jgi:orotate phosphoribosyltransferase
MDNHRLSRLKQLLLEYSYQEKEVRLASGRLSNFYFDGKQTSLHPEGATLIGQAMYELIQKNFPEVRAVGGPTLGADPIATAIAIASFQQGRPLYSFIVRKEPKGHGTMNWIEGAKHLEAGMKVVLVEDVITTGGSILKACQRVKEAGLNPLGVLVLVDREEGGREALEKEGLKVLSLFTKSELLQGRAS